MVHDKRDVEGKITVELDAEDWVWLCELLAEAINEPEIPEMVRDDFEHALSALQAFEDGR